MAASGEQLQTLESAYREAFSRERERLRRAGAPAGGAATSFALARRIRPSDPLERAVEAFEDVLTTLGWARTLTRSSLRTPTSHSMASPDPANAGATGTPAHGSMSPT